MYRRLFILIEGSDDGRFFDRIVRPIFEGKYDGVNIVEYAQTTPRVTRTFINSINARGCDYIFVTDINNAPCITLRKEKKREKFSNLDENKIIVVIKEIDSWYLAGLDNICCRKFRIPPHKNTDGVTKEQFNSEIPRKFEESRIDFLQEILKYFQVEIAKQKNKSFKDFLEKHDCE